MVLVAVKLLAVTLVMVVTLVALSRYAQRGGRGRGTSVRVAARHGVSRNAVVAVIEVDGRRFLVGAGEGQVSLLTELDPAAEVAEEPTTGPAPAPAPFARLTAAMAAAITHRAPHRTGPLTAGPGIGLLDRLRAMTVRTERPIHVPDRS
jgi:flagellar biogenesis protein FliO